MTDELYVNVYERDGDGVEQLVYRPMNADELAQAGEDAAAALDARRQAKAAEAQRALEATDAWVLRAYEEGVPLPDARAGHRELLRGLRGQAMAATTQEALDAITIPEPPPWNAA